VKRTARITLAPGTGTVARPDVLHRARPERRRPRPAEARPRTTAGPEAGEGAMSEAERELMRAMQEYKRSSGRMFPTWSEVLEVLQGLGYRKPA
jgi:hypothetical protein